MSNVYTYLFQIYIHTMHTVSQVIVDHIMWMHLILWGVLQYSTVWKYPPSFNNLPHWGI